MKINKHSERAEQLGETDGWVDVFESGTHRDKTYPPAAIMRMAQNFKKLSSGKKPILTVPAVVGHDEDQDFLNKSGWPAAGWPSKVRVVDGATPGSKKLQAIIGDIPPKLGEAINNKSYRKVSAEVYDDFVDPRTNEHHGPTLRRIAFLGGEIPQVKTLDDLPKVGYREEGGTFTAFMERKMKPRKFVELRHNPSEVDIVKGWKQAKAEGAASAKDFLDQVVRKKGGMALRSLAMDMGVPTGVNPGGKGMDLATPLEITQRILQKIGFHSERVRKHADDPTDLEPSQQAAPIDSEQRAELEKVLLRMGWDSKLVKELSPLNLVEAARVCTAQEQNPQEQPLDQDDSDSAGGPPPAADDDNGQNEASYGNAGDPPPPEPAPQEPGPDVKAKEPPMKMKMADTDLEGAPGEDVEQSPQDKETDPVNGPSGVQPASLNDESDGVESDDTEGEAFDEEQCPTMMSKHAAFHKQAARHYATKYADTDDADAKRSFASKATFHRNMAKKYDDNREFPARKEPPLSPAEGGPETFGGNRGVGGGGGGGSRGGNRGVGMHSEITRKFAELESRQHELEKIQRRQTHKSDRQSVTLFCENLCRQGRLLPAEKDARIEELMLLSNSEVRKFSDGRQIVSMTPRQRVMRRMETGPQIAKFGERFKDPAKHVNSADKFAERSSRLGQFWEKFGEELEAAGETYSAWESLVKSPKYSEADVDKLLSVK